MKNKYMLLSTGIVLIALIPVFSFLSGEQQVSTDTPTIDLNNEVMDTDGTGSCCMDPPCTECFDLIGTCNCDSLVAEGKIPCSECATALNCKENL